MAVINHIQTICNTSVRGNREVMNSCYKAHYINQRDDLLIDKLYDQKVTDEEIQQIAIGFGDWILEQIDERRKNWI